MWLVVVSIACGLRAAGPRFGHPPIHLPKEHTLSLRRSCWSHTPGVCDGKAFKRLIGEVPSGARIYAQHRKL